MRTILCILLASTVALAAADFSGAWSGTLERDGAKAPLSLTLLPDEDGLTGTVLFNGGAAARRPIEKAVLDGDQLTFESRDIEGNVTRFHLTVAGTKITGEANFGGQVWAVHLAKTLPSPAISPSSASSGVYRVGGGVSAPVLIQKTEPDYTEEARKNRLEGTVILYVQIAPTGEATNIKVVRSLGMGLDEKAVECVKKWKFKPGSKGDQPVTVEATIEVNFKI